MILKKLTTFISWTVASQLITIGSILIFSKFYSPHDFGILGLYTSYIAIASSVIGLRLDYAISSSDKGDEKSLLSICVCLGLISTVFTMPVFIFFVESVQHSASLAVISSFVMIFNALQAYYVKVAKVKIASISFFVRSLLMVFFQYLFIGNGLGLFIGYCLSFLITVLLFFPYRDFKMIPYVTYIDYYKKYFDFIRYNLPHTLLNTFGNNIPYYVINVIYGKEYVGYFTMAMRVVQVPHRFISNAIRQVMTSCYKDVGYLKSKILLSLYTKRLFLLSGMIFIPFFFYSELLFSVVLGDNWIMVGKITSMLCFWFAVSLCNVPAISFLTVFGGLKSLLKFEALSFIFRVGLFVFSLLIILDFNYFIMIFSLIGVLFNLTVIYESFRMNKDPV
ncbi:oligosaccharide flippase family protein [Vibrio cholerae]